MIVPSIRALEPLVGMSHTMLYRHFKNGKFEAEPGGGFDPEKVKAALKQNADPEQPSQSKASKASLPREEPPQREASTSNADYLKARAYREKLRAKTEELNLKERMGEVLASDEVRKTWHAIGRMYSQARENVPTQLAPRLIGKINLGEIEDLIRSFYREADTRIANEIQSRFAEIVGSDHDGDPNNPGLEAR